jgi:hypothetical protein
MENNLNGLLKPRWVHYLSVYSIFHPAKIIILLILAYFAYIHLFVSVCQVSYTPGFDTPNGDHVGMGIEITDNCKKFNFIESYLFDYNRESFRSFIPFSDNAAIFHNFSIFFLIPLALYSFSFLIVELCRWCIQKKIDSGSSSSASHR